MFFSFYPPWFWDKSVYYYNVKLLVFLFQGCKVWIHNLDSYKKSWLNQEALLQTQTAGVCKLASSWSWWELLRDPNFSYFWDTVPGCSSNWWPIVKSSGGQKDFSFDGRGRFLWHKGFTKGKENRVHLVIVILLQNL